MSQYFLSRIKVEGFRGINNEGQPLELKFKTDAVNSVFAENGSGKSSLFEALCYAIKGSVPKLRLLQASEKPETYVSNLFHSQRRAVIELDLTDESGHTDEVVITRSQSGHRVVTSPSGHAAPEELLESLNEDFTLLDYEQFNTFINATPLERGRSFAALLGLSGFSSMRQVLTSLNDSRNQSADFGISSLDTKIEEGQSGADAALARFKHGYTNLTGRQIVDTSKMSTWGLEVRDALSSIALLSPLIGTRKLSEIDFDGLRRAVQAAEGGKQRAELHDVSKAVLQLEASTSVDRDAGLETAGLAKRLLGTREALLKASKGSHYRALQVAGKNLLSSSEWTTPDKCPLCDSQLDGPLDEHVRDQVALYDELSEIEARLRSTFDSSHWLDEIAALENLSPLSIDPVRRKVPAFRAATASGRLDLEAIDDLMAWSDEVAQIRLTVLADSKRRKSELEKDMPPSLVAVTSKIELAQQALTDLNEYWRTSTALTRSRQQRKLYQRWQDFIKKATDDISQAEEQLSSARLAGLDSEYQSLFKQIMLVGDIVPELARTGSGENLDVRLGDFHGHQNLSARALLSESYRNALAISVFLSAAASQKMIPKFIVLDDITSSFDAGHQWRLMDEIRLSLQYHSARNSDGLQFIILSHDGLLEKYFDTISNGTEWHHQKLQGIPALGAVTAVGQDANRIRKTAEGFLSAGQVPIAEPLIRQYLEFALLQVIRKVQIPVPYDFAMRDSLKMVSNCLESITKAVELYDAAGVLAMSPQQKTDLERRHVPALIGNWVSHYATSVSASVSAPVLLGVLQSVDDLIDCFKYDDTSKTPATRVWYKSLKR